jgi:hypothetical protein
LKRKNALNSEGVESMNEDSVYETIVIINSKTGAEKDAHHPLHQQYITLYLSTSVGFQEMADKRTSWE